MTTGRNGEKRSADTVAWNPLHTRRGLISSVKPLAALVIVRDAELWLKRQSFVTNERKSRQCLQNAGVDRRRTGTKESLNRGNRVRGQGGEKECGERKLRESAPRYSRVPRRPTLLARRIARGFHGVSRLPPYYYAQNGSLLSLLFYISSAPAGPRNHRKAKSPRN